MSATSQQLAEQLSRNSTPYADPLNRINWDALNTQSYWLPEAAISLYGTDTYDSLDESQRKRLSQYEFINFIEGALWLESLFMGRISQSLIKGYDNLPRTIYRLHELREEAGHSLMFLELMKQSGLKMPNIRFSRPNLANILGRYAPFGSAAFWIAVTIGEEVPDRMNRLIRKHKETINPAVYDMITVHIIDEARHVAHARTSLEELIAEMPDWHLKIYQPVINMVFKQFVEAFYFPTNEVYHLAGLDKQSNWQKIAKTNTHRVEFVDDCVSSALNQLREHNLHLSWR